MMSHRYSRTVLRMMVAGVLVALPMVASADDNGTAVPTVQAINVEGVTFNLPDGWTVRQDARSNGVIIFGVEKGADYFQIYAKQGAAIDMKATFMNGATLVRDVARETHGSFNWNVLQSKRSRQGVGDVFVTSFMTTNGGSVIYGYSKGATAAASQSIVNGFLDQTR